MGERRKINFQGQEIWGEDLDFEAEREAWNTYLLHDGTKLKVRTVVSEIIRLDMYKPDGDPVYLLNSANVVTAVVPDRLKKKS